MDTPFLERLAIGAKALPQHFPTSTLLILAGAEQCTRTPLFWKPGFLLVADTLLPTPNSTLVEPSLRQVTMAAWCGNGVPASSVARAMLSSSTSTEVETWVK